VKAKAKVVYTSGLVLPNGDMLEEIKLDNGVFLAHCDSKLQPVQWNVYEFQGVTYKPIDNVMVSTNTVLLPSGTEKQGTTEALRAEIQEFIHSYCDISDYFEKLASYYVLLSWVYERFSVLPYLSVIGEPGTGKSRFLQVVGSLCYKPMRVSGAISVASIFRLIAEFHGTLILEEADLSTKSDEYSGAIKILNCGFEKGNPVIRQEQTKRGYESVAYDVFCPKIVSRRKRFEDRALETRMITERMTKMTRREIRLTLPSDFNEQALHIRNKLLSFRFVNYHKIKPSEVYKISGIEPRILQIVSPMFDIMPEDERDGLIGWAKSYTQDLITERGASIEGDVVRALFEVIDNSEDATVKNVADKLNAQFERDVDKISYRRVGAMVTYLGLIKRRTGKGFIIDTYASSKTLELLRRQYGIDG
jgi:hypothetical protein